MIRRIWPWSTIHRLALELRGARLSCSAADKKANRLAARIQRLESVIARLRSQIRRDQSYIDALEARLDPPSIDAARRSLPGAVTA